MNSSNKNLHTKVVDSVLVVTIDCPGAKVNSLGKEINAEFDLVLKELDRNDGLSSAVFISGKPGCFMAGANIHMLAKCTSAQEAEKIAHGGQIMFDRIEKSRKPIVAMIHGVCLGGGFELALACHYRIATKDKKTNLGLPEVLLGLLPGSGGTQRLPKLSGIQTALDLAITGKSINAEKAKSLGIVDQVALLLEPSTEQDTYNYLENVAINVAKDISGGKFKINRKKPELDNMETEHLIENTNKFMFELATKQIMKRTGGLYPAPLKILEVIKTGVLKGEVAGYEAERRGFGELAMTKESKGLIAMFQGQTECKKNRFGKPKQAIKTVAVVGAGMMGSGIVKVSIEKGFKVVIKDTNETALRRGISYIEKHFEDDIKRSRITTSDRDKYMSNMTSTLDYSHFKNADIVIEAVFEDLDIKHKVIKELEAVIPPHCIIATNTSAIPITKIAARSSRPDKIIGMHYFSPADKMQLLEIITHPGTSKDTIAAAVAMGLKQGKIVIIVGDGPGFYTTRIMGMLFHEMMSMFVEGVDPKDVDKVTKKFGFPVGVATLIDEIGLDVIMHCYNNISQYFGERLTTEHVGIIRELIDDKSSGRKSGKGFYIYDKSQKKGPREVNPVAKEIFKKYHTQSKGPNSEEDLQIRIVSRFVNEAVLCLEEKILHNPLEGDVGAVFGLGFPPFTGGPFRWVDSFGAGKLVDKMRGYADIYGVRFQPAQTLVDMANNPNKKFYNDISSKL